MEILDDSWNPVAVTLATNGTGASSASTELAYRVNLVYIPDDGCGTYGGSNTGTIEIENTTSGSVLGEISPGAGQSEQAIYTVRAGYDAYLAAAEFEVDSPKAVEIRMCQRRSADVISAPFAAVRITHRIQALTGPVNWGPGVYVQFPEKTDIWVEAKSGSGGGGVNARFDLELARNIPLAVPQ